MPAFSMFYLLSSNNNTDRAININVQVNRNAVFTGGTNSTFWHTNLSFAQLNASSRYRRCDISGTDRTKQLALITRITGDAH